MIILGRHSGDARPDAGISGGKKMERKGMAAADGPAEREKMKGFVLAGVEDARYMTLEYAEALRKNGCYLEMDKNGHIWIYRERKEASHSTHALGGRVYAAYGCRTVDLTFYRGWTKKRRAAGVFKRDKRAG